jgi:hypothetical protein
VIHFWYVYVPDVGADSTSNVVEQMFLKTAHIKAGWSGAIDVVKATDCGKYQDNWDSDCNCGSGEPTDLAIPITARTSRFSIVEARASPNNVPASTWPYADIYIEWKANQRVYYDSAKYATGHEVQLYLGTGYTARTLTIWDDYRMFIYSTLDCSDITLGTSSPITITLEPSEEVTTTAEEIWIVQMIKTATVAAQTGSNYYFSGSTFWRGSSDELDVPYTTVGSHNDSHYATLTDAAEEIDAEATTSSLDVTIYPNVIGEVASHVFTFDYNPATDADAFPKGNEI